MIDDGFHASITGFGLNKYLGMGSEPTSSLSYYKGKRRSSSIMFGISFLDFSSNDLFFLFNTVVFGNVSYQGTEYFDGKTKRYVDFPLTEILQMMGRAGRPQFDQHGKAVILVHEPKKSFYKKVKLNWNYLAFFWYPLQQFTSKRSYFLCMQFLYEPFPVESSLKEKLHDHFNAEIVSGTIGNKEDAVHYLTWTYLFRRLVNILQFY